MEIFEEFISQENDMEKTLEEKKELAAKVIAALKKEYPDADCTLDYNEAWKLLVSVRLAAQCTDARVNVVVQDLYKKFPDVKALAEADVDAIEEIVRPCGLGRSKAPGHQRLHEDPMGAVSRKCAGRFRCPFKASGRWKKECEPDHGRCLRKTGDRYRHPLHSLNEPDRSCGRDPGTEKSGDGALEDHPAGRGK